MQPPPNAAASGGVLAAALWQHAPVAAAALAASGGLLQASKRGAARRFAALSGGARRRAASWVRQNRGTPGSCEGTTHAVSSICSTSSCHAASSSAWEQLGGGAPAWLRRAASGGSGSNSGGGGCGGGGGGGWRPASSAPSTWQHGLLASPPPPWRPAAPRAAAARGLHASPSAREQQQPPHPAAPGPASGPAENATAGGRALRAHDAVDALKVAALIHRFRARGHLMAQLDPLQRCKGGPWVGPIGQENDRWAARSRTRGPGAAPAAAPRAVPQLAGGRSRSFCAAARTRRAADARPRPARRGSRRAAPGPDTGAAAARLSACHVPTTHPRTNFTSPGATPR